MRVLIISHATVVYIPSYSPSHIIDNEDFEVSAMPAFPRKKNSSNLIMARKDTHLKECEPTSRVPICTLVKISILYFNQELFCNPITCC